jgi:hypothetical protein
MQRKVHASGSWAFVCERCVAHRALKALAYRSFDERPDTGAPRAERARAFF